MDLAVLRLVLESLNVGVKQYSLLFLIFDIYMVVTVRSLPALVVNNVIHTVNKLHQLTFPFCHKSETTAEVSSIIKGIQFLQELSFISVRHLF